MPITVKRGGAYIDASVFTKKAGAYVDGALSAKINGAYVSVGEGGPGAENVAIAKAAAATAPTTVSAIESQAGPAATLLSSSETPTWLYQRYWISGSGRDNGGGQSTNPLLPTVAFIYNFANWQLVFGSGVPNSMSDGSSALFWFSGTDQSSSPPMIGIRTNSRYLAVPSMNNNKMSLIVDGKQIAPGIVYTANSQNAVWDFESQTDREIVLVGGLNTWFSEILIEDGATIAPYDFTADKPVTMSFMGDSYAGYEDTEGSGLTFLDMMARMIGGLAITASNRGGTGYRTDSNEGVEWQGRSATRIARVTEALPTIMAPQLGLNDVWPDTGPTTLAAMTTALQGMRAANPDGILLVMGPWAPSQSAGANPGGKYIAIMDALAPLMAGIAGPWILLDNLRGNWTTSKGTSRGSLRGPWQTGDGYVGNTTGTGNGDTWVRDDGTHPTVPLGITGLSEIWAAETRAALATL